MEHSYRLSVLGATQSGSYPLYCVETKHKRKPQRYLCISAGIHGDEHKGPLAVLKLLESGILPSARDTGIIIFPVVNPWGFERYTRRNARGNDLNRRFNLRVLDGENAFVYDRLKPLIASEKLKYFLSLHEDDSAGAYIFGYGKNNERHHRELLGTLKKITPIFAGSRRYQYSLKRGLALDVRDDSFDDRMNRDGIPYAICYEAPNKQPLNTIIASQIALISHILSILSKKSFTNTRGSNGKKIGLPW